MVDKLDNVDSAKHRDFEGNKDSLKRVVIRGLVSQQGSVHAIKGIGEPDINVARNPIERFAGGLFFLGASGQNVRKQRRVYERSISRPMQLRR